MIELKIEDLKLITHYESLHDGDLSVIGLQPKMDAIGIWTEGWGRAMRYNGDFIRGAKNKALAYSRQTIHTVEEADKAMLIDIKPFIEKIQKRITRNLNKNETVGLLSHFYNTGGSDTLCNLINTNSPNLYEWWISHYITADGVKMKGLKYRRKSEAELFTNNKLVFYN